MIRHYRPLYLPSDGYAAATTCLDASRPPGEGDEFRATARLLARVAQQLCDSIAELRAIAADRSAWTGEAADAFRSAVTEPSNAHLDQVPARYDGYARQLQSYAAALDDSQPRIGAARTQVQDAVGAYRSALARRSRFAGAPAQLLLAATAPDVQAAVQECDAAARRFQAEYNAWVDAANRCIDGLKSIDRHDKLHNPHGARAAVGSVAHAISGLMNELAGLSSVLAVVSLALCPELAVVFFAVASVATQLQFAADVGREACQGHVGWRALALDALGSIPYAGPLKGAAAAVREARAAEGALTRGARAAGAFGSEVGRAFGDALKRDPAHALEALSRRGAMGGSVPSVARRGRAVADAKLDLAGFLPPAASNAYDNRRQGLVEAIGLCAFRITWQPVKSAVPKQVATGVGASATTIEHLPDALRRIGVR